MQWISMLSWWQWLLVAVVPAAIVALYFLKLKRQSLEVPSTYLWHKSIEDLHVNSLWQRLRQSLLLYLQLLLVALLIIALLGPTLEGSKTTGARSIFLIDNSASMSSTDIKPTRLVEAKRRVSELIDAMSSGDVAMIVSFSDSARVAQQFTDNRSELRQALERIAPTNHTTSLDEALRVASGLANPGRSGERGGVDTAVAEALPAKVYIFSDGKFPDVQGFTLGNLEPVFVPIGELKPTNVGIIAFSSQRNEERPDHMQAFAQLANFAPGDVTLQAELHMDDQLVDAQQVQIAQDSGTGVAFDLGEINSGVLKLQLAEADALDVDNKAWTAIRMPRRAKVLFVSPGNESLDAALRTHRATEIADITTAAPSVLETPEHLRQTREGTYDLVIYDSCSPKEMPLANTLFVGAIPPMPTWSKKDNVFNPQIIDVDQNHPLTYLLEMTNVLIGDATPLEPPPGSTKLIESTDGTLLAIGPREGFEDAVLAFPIFRTDKDGDRVYNTDWDRRLSFPLFLLNALNYLGGRYEGQAIGSARPGQPVTLRSVTHTDVVTVRSPSGKTTDVRRGRQNDFPFTDTEELGVYDVLETGKVTQQFAVNLFDNLESDIRPRPENSIKIGYTQVEGDQGWEPSRHDLWKVLVILALVVLLLEWYIYNRRVYL